MCCQDRASASIFFHSSALSWSFLAAMFSSRCATDDVPGIGNMTGKPPIWSKKLRAQNVASEELIFPDEIHDLLRWSDWVRAYRATAEFFDRKLAAPSDRP